MLLLCPGYCLINSKMIVCNFTKMEMEMNSWCFIWFLLFPVNSARKFFYFSIYFAFTFSVGLVIPQEVVAAYIGLVNLSEYSVFVYCTIGQITKFLDIYCLSIKPKKQVSPSSTQSSSPIHPSKKGDWNKIFSCWKEQDRIAWSNLANLNHSIHSVFQI